MRAVFLLGAAQKWFAQGYRQGNALEKVCIFPLWCVTRGAFMAVWPVAEAILKRRAAQ